MFYCFFAWNSKYSRKDKNKTRQLEFLFQNQFDRSFKRGDLCLGLCLFNCLTRIEMELKKEQTPLRVSRLKVQAEGGFCHPGMPGGKQGLGRSVLQVAPRALCLSLSPALYLSPSLV